MMTVTEALEKRRSIRAFLPKVVEREKLEAILKAASRTPSWGNSQPWEIYTASGKALETIHNGFTEKRQAKTASKPEIAFPNQYTEAAKARTKHFTQEVKDQCGEAAVNLMPLNQAMFNAPMIVYPCMDKIMSVWSLYDIGAWTQSFMLAAVEQGLATIPAIQLAIYPEVIHQALQIPDNLEITIGIALGYEDTSNGINKLVTSRSPLNETVKIVE
jgi:nitroreductase